MKSGEVDWPELRSRAARFSEEAFEFVRDGLKHCVNTLRGPAVPGADASENSRRHVTGQELCIGLRELSIQRWGLLAGTVLRKWGIRRTEDFGTIVYAMIDRRELRSSESDRIEDFSGVFDFDEAFGALSLK